MNDVWRVVARYADAHPQLLVIAAVLLLLLAASVVVVVGWRHRVTRAAPQPAPTRLRSGLAKTREGLLARVGPLLGRPMLDAAARDELEAALLAADVGVAMTGHLLAMVREHGRAEAVPARAALERAMKAVLETAHRESPPAGGPPWVVMVVGVNGVGKTTSIGKLAWRYTTAGKRAMLVAADTFRAAAGEQLAVWAERAQAQLVRQQTGGDPAAVAYDGLRAAVARGLDVVLVDTAGRLHTKSNLIEELRKVRRVMARAVAGAPHETLLVVDAGTGQNGLAQARIFVEELGATGVILTKLDGTAKGGVIIAIAGEMGIPVRYVGVGERAEDLRDFDADEFVAALFEAREPPGSLDS